MSNWPLSEIFGIAIVVLTYCTKSHAFMPLPPSELPQITKIVVVHKEDKPEHYNYLLMGIVTWESTTEEDRVLTQMIQKGFDSKESCENAIKAYKLYYKTADLTCSKN